MPSASAIAWLHRLIWLLIYGGLLTLIVGLKTEDSSPVAGWALVAGGGAAAALGFFLIWVRSRMPDRTIEDPKEKNR